MLDRRRERRLVNRVKLAGRAGAATLHPQGHHDRPYGNYDGCHGADDRGLTRPSRQRAILLGFSPIRSSLLQYLDRMEVSVCLNRVEEARLAAIYLYLSEDGSVCFGSL